MIIPYFERKNKCFLAIICYNVNMVKIYTTKTCAYCHALMDWLDSMGIEYKEVDAEGNPEIKTVPVTEINGERIVGFDRPAIKRALRDIDK